MRNCLDRDDTEGRRAAELGDVDAIELVDGEDGWVAELKGLAREREGGDVVGFGLGGVAGDHADAVVVLICDENVVVVVDGDGRGP